MEKKMWIIGKRITENENKDAQSICLFINYCNMYVYTVYSIYNLSSLLCLCSEFIVYYRPDYFNC